MPMKFLQRIIVFAGLALLAAGVTVFVAAPAQADNEVELSVSPSTVHPGDTVMITQTITNSVGFTILNPRARFFSTPQALTSYTSLVSCSGTGLASCNTVNGPDGPIGYQGVLSEALGNGESATIILTLQISAEAPDLTETLQGQLFGSNYATNPVDGPTLTVDASADAAVSLSVTPKFGLLVPRLDFAVRVTNNGPATLRNAEITTTLPAGLNGTASGPCAPAAGQVVCTVAQLADGAQTTVTFSVPLHLLSIGLPYTFTSTLTGSDSPDPHSANNSASRTCTVITPLLVNCS